MKEYIDFAVEQIENLCRTPSPTGFTVQAEEYIVRELVKLGYNPGRTRKGTVIADLGGEGEGLVLAAHVDTLGAMVRSVKSNGRLRLTKLGGYPENNIEGENCSIYTRTGKVYSGTIQLTKPSIHVYEDTGSLKRDETTVEVIIDEKVHSKEDVSKLEIQAGDFIVFDPRTVVTSSGFIKSRHLDDKASAGILLAVAKYIKEEKIQLKRKIWLLFTVYEEVGHGGSAGLPEGITEMLVVDMGAVGDDLQTDEYKVSICAKDSGGPYDYEVTSRLIRIAREQKLQHAVDIYPKYGSDAGAALRAGYDIKHGLIGPGVFASHGYERTHIEGVENTFKLLAAYVQEL